MVQLFPISVSRSFKLVSLLLIILPVSISGQDTIPRNWSLNGYLTNMQSFMFQSIGGDWTVDNLIHNRLNFEWNSKSGNLKTVLELPNRFIIGESVEANPDYVQIINTDNGYVKLSDNISTGKSYIFNSRIDRGYIDYTKDKFQLTIGRQRINW